MMATRDSLARFIVTFAAVTLAACGSSGSDGNGGTNEPPTENPPTDPGPTDPPTDPGPTNPPAECVGQEFSSTFEAIQQVVFERNGCTQQVCHGSGAAGGLDLSPDVAYDNLFQQPSVGSAVPLVWPGDRTRSNLWLKLAAATDPGSVEITGAPMPNGLPPITAEELEAVRMWIYAGAPRDATVDGTEELLDACLPEPEPITIEPLEAPAADEGFQLVLPPWEVPASSEHEICFASWYDVTDQVPVEYQDPSNPDWFRWKAFDLRQDPQSHHLILYFPADNFTPGGIDPNDPVYGEWTCAGGDTPGAPCEPKDKEGCGAGGFCISEVDYNSFACIGFGGGGISIPVGGAQQAQAFANFYPGVFAQLPSRGLIYWNSHAFNLTTKDADLNGRINYLYADEQEFPVQNIFNTSRIFAANAAPFTTQTVCGTHELPQGARVFELTSHTHQRGKGFTIDLPDGTRVYESYIYNDPVRQRYDPPLAFDSPDQADRVLTYCSLYNNGVAEDGSPDIETVTRYSRLPEQIRAGDQFGRCTPVACVNDGMVGEPCNGLDDDAACDTSPGAGDGWCDACPITGGESTENEMFNLFGTYYLDAAFAAQAAAEQGLGSAAYTAVDATGRSLYSGPAVPHMGGCSAAAAGHAAHMGH